MVTSRILFTAKQKDELWERWKNGQSVLARLQRRRWKGGTRPASGSGSWLSMEGSLRRRRRRAVAALKLEEREEEISRGDCGRPVGPSDRTRSQTIAIDDKPGDSTQRRFAGLPCKPGRQARLGAGAAP